MADQVRALPPSQVNAKTVWTVMMTGLAIAALVLLVFDAWPVLTRIAVAALVALALDHAVKALTRWFPRLPRAAAIALAFLGLLVALSAVALVLVPPLVTQLQSLAGSLPSIIERIRESALYAKLEGPLQIEEQIAELQRGSPDYLADVLGVALTAIAKLIGALGTLAMILFFSLFMLAFGPGLVRRLVAEAMPCRRERYSRLLDSIHRAVGGYLIGQTMIVAANGTLMAIFLAILGIPYFLPLALLSALASLVPMVGAAIAGAVVAVVALLAGGLWKAVGVAVYVFVYQQIENQVLGPLVYRKTVALNPLISVLALAILGHIGGLVWAILSVPVIAIAQIIVRELLRMRRERLGLDAA